MTTDKHMDKARELRNAVNWQSNGSIKHIAAALAAAERDGMRRAAEIARSFDDRTDILKISGYGVAAAIEAEAGEREG